MGQNAKANGISNHHSLSSVARGRVNGLDEGWAPEGGPLRARPSEGHWAGTG